ncbi:MAG: tRNA 2-thiouridine(34) synthase MnmA, partial [Actinomycetota bacterium]|nr:tRNA 2-thiouridine(34) synthase MnmA [Actinomycetota bacterium]
ADPTKDQSYVLSMLGQDQLARVRFPIGAMTKAEVRAEAERLGLRTAAKPDSQDVCFIRSDTGRERFLADRIDLHPGRLVDDGTGAPVGEVAAVELVTVGQRRGMGHGTDGRRRYVTAIDVRAGEVRVGPPEAAMATGVDLHTLTWVDGPVGPGAPVVAQCSAHGVPLPATLEDPGAPGRLRVRFDRPARRVAPGQTVALYDASDPDAVVGSGVVA